MVALIWATRGRTWGFRFLLSGGLPDPLSVYERAFADMQGEPAACRRAGTEVALRFLDPLDRKDSAGRVIPHDFVILDPAIGSVESVDDGLRNIWPLVADAYARAWSRETPPEIDTV